MTVYAAKGRNTGVAVVVLPGAITSSWPWAWRARKWRCGAQELPSTQTICSKSAVVNAGQYFRSLDLRLAASGCVGYTIAQRERQWCPPVLPCDDSCCAALRLRRDRPDLESITGWPKSVQEQGPALSDLKILVAVLVTPNLSLNPSSPPPTLFSTQWREGPVQVCHDETPATTRWYQRKCSLSRAIGLVVVATIPLELPEQSQQLLLATSRDELFECFGDRRFFGRLAADLQRPLNYPGSIERLVAICVALHTYGYTYRASQTMVADMAFWNWQVPSV